jgi:hypothetical protein
MGAVVLKWRYGKENERTPLELFPQLGRPQHLESKLAIAHDGFPLLEPDRRP